MSEDGKILNRGLDALLGSQDTNNQRTVKDVDPGLINRRKVSTKSKFRRR